MMIGNFDHVMVLSIGSLEPNQYPVVSVENIPEYEKEQILLAEIKLYPDWIGGRFSLLETGRVHYRNLSDQIGMVLVIIVGRSYGLFVRRFDGKFFSETGDKK